MLNIHSKFVSEPALPPQLSFLESETVDRAKTRSSGEEVAFCDDEPFSSMPSNGEHDADESWRDFRLNIPDHSSISKQAAFDDIVSGKITESLHVVLSVYKPNT